MAAGNVTQTGHTYPTTFESMKNKIAAVGDWIEAQGVKLTLDATEVLHRQNVAAIGYEYEDLDDLLAKVEAADAIPFDGSLPDNATDNGGPDGCGWPF